MIKRIHVQYQLRAGDADPDAIQRAMEKHPPYCPVYRSLHPQIDISLSLELIDD